MAAVHSPGRVVAATGNPGKVRELAAALAPLRLDLVAQGDLGIEPAPETASTFIENALGKARHAACRSGLPAIADDSGLVVPALGGAPGIRSARYAGENASDADNNAKLLRALADARAQDGRTAAFCVRAAFFTCSLVYLATADDPAPIIATGCWHGRIVDIPRGINGFGYDPHFHVPSLGKTAAQLTLAEKNRLSHRGQACRQLAARLAANAAADPPANEATRGCRALRPLPVVCAQMPVLRLQLAPVEGTVARGSLSGRPAR